MTSFLNLGTCIIVQSVICNREGGVEHEERRAHQRRQMAVYSVRSRMSKSWSN